MVSTRYGEINSRFFRITQVPYDMYSDLPLSGAQHYTGFLRSQCLFGPPTLALVTFVPWPFMSDKPLPRHEDPSFLFKEFVLGGEPPHLFSNF